MPILHKHSHPNPLSTNCISTPDFQLCVSDMAYLEPIYFLVRGSLPQRHNPLARSQEKHKVTSAPLLADPSSTKFKLKTEHITISFTPSPDYTNILHTFCLKRQSNEPTRSLHNGKANHPPDPRPLGRSHRLHASLNTPATPRLPYNHRLLALDRHALHANLRADHDARRRASHSLHRQTSRRGPAKNSGHGVPQCRGILGSRCNFRAREG
jgi:hypothetical protein